MIEENENPFAQWKHIHFVGKFNLDIAHPKLYRYELFSRLKTMYNKNEIVFPSPILWKDLFEQRLLSDSFLKYCFGKKGTSYRKKIYAICCTGDGTENADAQWNTRKLEKGDFCVRYTINLWKLLNRLNSFSQNNDGCVDFYLSSMSYEYSQEELMGNQHIQAMNVKKLPDKSLDDKICYLVRAMSYKRRQFKYENEIRIWAVLNERDLSPSMIKDNMLRIPLDWTSLGVNVLVGPYNSDIKVENTDKLNDYNQKKRSKENEVQQKWATEVAQKIKISPNRVLCSRIYDVPPWKCSKNLKTKEK